MVLAQSCFTFPWAIEILGSRAYIVGFFNVYLFLRVRQREHKLGRGRDGGRHRIRSRLRAPSCQRRARCGARTHEPRDHDLSRSPKLNRLSHPSALGHLDLSYLAIVSQLLLLYVCPVGSLLDMGLGRDRLEREEAT